MNFANIAQALSTTDWLLLLFILYDTWLNLLPVKCSLCQIRRLKSHKFLPRLGRETWQTTCCSLSSHHLQFITCWMPSERKCSLLTITTTDELLWEVNKRIKHASLSVVRHPRCVVGCHPLWHTMQDKTISCRTPDAHWSFPSPCDALCLPGEAVIGMVSCSLTPAYHISYHFLHCIKTRPWLTC